LWFCLWEKTCNICLSESSFFAECDDLLYFILLQITEFHFMLHCVYIPLHLYLLSVNRHLRWLHGSSVMNRDIRCECASISTFKLIFIPFGYIPRSGTEKSYGISISFNFWGTSVLISVLVVPIYIPTKSVWGLLFPKSSLVFVVIYFLNDRHSYDGEMEYPCSFIFFPLFMYLLICSFVLVEFELKALHLLGRTSTTCAKTQDHQCNF
jgi:hypothetical protein